MGAGDLYPEYAQDWVGSPRVTLKLRMLTEAGVTRQFKLSGMRPDLTPSDVKAIAAIMILNRKIYKNKPIKLSGASINVKISRYVPIDLE